MEPARGQPRHRAPPAARARLRAASRSGPQPARRRLAAVPERARPSAREVARRHAAGARRDRHRAVPRAPGVLLGASSTTALDGRPSGCAPARRRPRRRARRARGAHRLAAGPARLRPRHRATRGSGPEKLRREALGHPRRRPHARRTCSHRAEADLVRIEGEIARAAADYLGEQEPPPDDAGAARTPRARRRRRRRPGRRRHRPAPCARTRSTTTTAFVREHDLVTVHDDPVEIVEMPEIHRGVAVAYCDPPGPLETAELPTFFAVAPTPTDWDAARVASFYREYNARMLHNLTVHEAMPGPRAAARARPPAAVTTPGAAGVLERPVRRGLGGLRRAAHGRARLRRRGSASGPRSRSACSS